MKKVFIAFALLSAIALGSCKRSYTCKCQDNSTGTVQYTYPVTSASTATIAKTQCVALSDSAHSKICDLQ